MRINSQLKIKAMRSGSPKKALTLLTLALINLNYIVPALAETDLKGPISSETQLNNDLSDSVTITRPSFSALISITRTADPFSLDSKSSRPISLDEAAHLAIYNNLDIGVGGLNEHSRKLLYLASLGKFLPDVGLSYNYNYLQGHANLPFIGFGAGGLHFNNPVIITGAALTYHAFRGGSILYGALQSKANYRAAQHAQRATVNDTLLQSAKLFYDLLLQEALLAVRITAVQTSQELLKQNKDLREGGLATALDVYQSETQLSSDRQNLIDQQINRRNIAIQLAQYLNLNQGEDLTSATNQLQKIRLVSEQLRPTNLLSIAIEHRPELKQYQELRLAAKREINIALAKLLPTFDLHGGVVGAGETLGPSSTSVTTSAVAVGPGGGSVITTPITIKEDRRISAIGVLGYNLNWHFEGLGTVDAANTQYAKLLARQAQLQQQKVLNQVIADVRQSYLNTLGTENKINETTTQVNSATEELRLAKLRFQYGLGKNIDILRAQQDYTTALIAKAQAIAYFNIAQAQLLRDLGVLSTATLTARTPFKG